MTKEEAINRLTNTLQEMRAFFFDSKHISEDDEKDLASMEMAIEALEQEPKWIPVSERLPEKNMVCLVAVGEFNLTQMAMYSDLMGTIDHKIFYQGDYGKENFANITQYVKAWMPLPKPYKAESEDQ